MADQRSEDISALTGASPCGPADSPADESAAIKQLTASIGGGTAEDSTDRARNCSSLGIEDAPLHRHGAIGEYVENAVFVNVYDIVSANTVLYHFGLGLHHTGVEVYGSEIAFGRCTRGTGVFDIAPKSCPGHVFRESIFVGYTPKSLQEVRLLINELALTWQGSDYHILRRNCNSFSENFVRQLLQDDRPTPLTANGKKPKQQRCGKAKVPSWTNRVARWATKILPERLNERIELLDRAAQGM